MGIVDDIKKWVLEPEPDDPDQKESEKSQGEEYQKDFQKEENIENLDAVILVAKPKTFKDAQVLCDQIKKGRAIMLSLEYMVPEEKQRLVDFLSGVVMAQDGLIAKVYDSVYVCAAKNIGIIDMK